MKKILSCILVIAMAFAFVGCDTVSIMSKFPEPKPTQCPHRDTEWFISIYPSVMADGKEYEKCLDCHEKLQIRVLEKLPCDHKTVYREKIKTPTTLEEGVNKVICSLCNEELGTEPIKAVGYDAPTIKEKLSQSVFKVYAYDYSPKDHYFEYQGTGFFIDEHGTFITNAHVIENCSEIKVLINGKKYSVEKPLYYDYVNSDIAILRIKGNFKSTPIEFSKDVEVFDTVFALGFPNDAPEIQTTQGKILNEAYIVDGVAYFLFNAEVDHGSSGGILCDRFGRVIGVVTLGWDSGVNGALKYKFFEHLVEDFKVK